MVGILEIILVQLLILSFVYYYIENIATYVYFPSLIIKLELNSVSTVVVLGREDTVFRHDDYSNNNNNCPEFRWFN